MVTSVQLGNFFTANGRTVLGGVGGSGLDTQGLIEGLSEAKALPKKALEDKIALNDKKSAALSEFQTLLSKFKDANNFLRNPPGVANAASNVFKAATTSVTSNTAISGSAYVSVTASAGSTLQSYAISEITSIAKATQQGSDDILVADASEAQAVFTSAGAGEIQAGSITLRGKTITLSDGDTLNAVASKFNAVSSTTNISASVIQVESGKYQLLFSSTKTGTANAFNLNNLASPDVIVDANGVLAHLGLTNKQTASDAVFIINDTEITRSTNNISDVIEGVTFNLLQATPVDTEININITADKELIKSGIYNFVNTYNELRTFAAKQMEVKSDGSGFADTAILHDTAVFRSTLDNMTAYISGVVSGLESSAPSLLADIGITFSDLEKTLDTPQVKNILSVDEGKLSTAIETQTEDVRRIFEFDFNSDNPSLRVFKRGNALSATDFTVTVNPHAIQTTGIITVADADTAIVSASPAAGEFKAGVLTINGQTITLAVGDTLNNIITKFTAAQAGTGVTATLNTVDTGQYTLAFTATATVGSTNYDFESSAIDPDGVFDSISLTSTAAYKATYLVNAVPTTVDLDATLISPTSGYLLKGQAGTALEGLQLVYSSILTSLITVEATQGVSDKLFNITEAVLIEDTGALAIELTSLKDADTKLTEDIQKIEDQVAIFRNRLIEQFSALEQAISRVNTLLQSLQADSDARNNN